MSNAKLRTVYDEFGLEGVESAMQLGEYLDGDLSKLREALGRLRREKLLGGWRSKTLLSTGIDASMLTEDWSPIADQISWQDYIPQCSSIAMTHRMEGLVLDDVSAQINISAAVKSGNGSSLLSGTLSKPVSDRLRVRIEGAIAGPRRLGLGLAHALSQKMSLDYLVSWHFHGGSILPHYQLTLSRVLGSSMISSISVFGDADYNYGASLGLSYLSETSPASVSTQYHHRSGSLSLDAKVAHLINPQNTLKLRLSTSSLAQLSFGLVRRFSDDTGRKTSVMLEMGVNLGVALKWTISVADVHFIFPIYIARELSSHSLLFGAALPSLCGLLLHNFVLQPYHRWQRQCAVEDLRQKSKTLIEQQRQEALMVILLMEPFFERRRQQEIDAAGLVISRATYEPASPMGSPLDERKLAETPELVLDVTVPLQLLVEDSHLVLPSGTKSRLLGFYNVALGAPKVLRIHYSFRGATHTAIFLDTQPVMLPLRSHLEP